MKKIFRKIALWIVIKIHSIFIMISIALRNTELEILKADPNDLNDNKKIHQKWFRSPLLQKFHAGQKDEKYVQDYYKLLKKADEFALNASQHKKAVAADRWSMNLGEKDQYGRRYDHIGFFDPNHKYYGKTMKEVIEQEKKERRTKDDDYELLAIINNNPIPVGLSEIDSVVDEKYNVNDLQKVSKKFKFPIKIKRNKEVVNKIEELTEFMHIKKIGFEYRQLEFFIPLKFKTNEIKNNSKIFKELKNIKFVYVKDAYGELAGFNVQKFYKRINHENTYEVWKFKAKEMKTIKT